MLDTRSITATLRLIREKTVKMLSSDGNATLKKCYLKLATFCSTYGFSPPFSAKAEKSEQGWRMQSADSRDRNPNLYTKYDETIDFLFQDVLGFLDSDSCILEIGCNAGRSLDYLYKKGYTNLTGIEIGAEAEKAMQQTFPQAYRSTHYILGNAYEELAKLPEKKFDLVFCHSVLVNITPRWNGVFKEMARVSKKYILILENEGSLYAYPRDFERMFKKAGYRQILYKFYSSMVQSGRMELKSPFTPSDLFRNNVVRLFVEEKH